jgi:hypothetical protein
MPRPKQLKPLDPEYKDERTAQIVSMKRAHVPTDEISAQLGISTAHVNQIYRKALAENSLTALAIDEHRAEQVDLIEAMIRELMCIAYDQRKSDRSRIDAILSVKSFIEEKAKLLGLYSPTRTEIVTLGALELEITQLEAELNAPIRAELTRGDSAGAAAAAGGAEGPESS